MKVEHARLTLASARAGDRPLQIEVGSPFGDASVVTFSVGTVGLKEARELGRFLVGLPDDEPAVEPEPALRDRPPYSGEPLAPVGPKR